MTTTNRPAARIASASDFDPNHYRPGRILQALTELLTERTDISLDDLYRIGLIMLRMKKKDIALTSLFINKWDTLSMCGQNEDMVQCVADLCDELVRQMLLTHTSGGKQAHTEREFAWLRVPELVSDVFSYGGPAATAA